MSRVDVILGGKNAGFKKMLTQSRQEARSFGKGMMNALNLGNAFGAANLGAMLIGSVRSLVGSVLGEFDRIAKVSLRVDMDPDQVRRYGVAANLAGASLAKLEKAWSTMVKAGVLAEDGLDSYSKEFKRLGVDIAKFQKLDVEGKWLMIADAYSKSTDKASAYAAVQVIMGGQSRDLIPLLSMGADGIREMTAEMGDMDASDFRAIENFNDQMTMTSENLKVMAGENLPSFFAAIRTGFNGLSSVFRFVAGGFAQLATRIAIMTDGYGDLSIGERWELANKMVAEIGDETRAKIEGDMQDIEDAWSDADGSNASYSDSVREAQRETARLAEETEKAAAKAEVARKRAEKADARSKAAAERAEDARQAMLLKYHRKRLELARLVAEANGDGDSVRNLQKKLDLLEKFSDFKNSFKLDAEKALDLAKRELDLEERIADAAERRKAALEDTKKAAEAAESERDALGRRADGLSGGVDSLQSIGLGAGGVRYSESREVVKLREMAVERNKLLMKLTDEVAELELSIEEAQF